MLPASLYTPLYYHTMLLVVFGCALLYWMRQGRHRNLTQFNQVAMVVIGAVVLLFIGLRPVSGVFVDMVTYAQGYDRLQQGFEPGFKDFLFVGLMRLCAPVLPAGGFFLVCALIYIAPLAVASWRVHGAWAFPVFLACLTALSFWGYGVNGIRNGMATSVLILAFAFYDKPVVMFPLMLTAWGLHGSVLLPAVAFLTARYVRRTEILLAFWVLCVTLTFIAGNVGEMLLSRYNPFVGDNRVESYVVNSGDSGGFRADFLAYSIIPIIVTLSLAAPTRARLRRSAPRIMRKVAMNWMRKRRAMAANRMGIGRLAGQHGVSQQAGLVGSACSAGVVSGSTNVWPVVCFGGEAPPELAAGAAALRCVSGGFSRTRVGHGSHNPRRGPAGPGKASGSQTASARRGKSPKTAWGSLPWVRLLQTDPFYARLVNTYLLANGIWVLLMHANFSNRFAYLSWFMLPWVLLYPFVPSKIIQRPRTGLIAAVLCAHYMFTYVMVVVVVPLRGGGIF